MNSPDCAKEILAFAALRNNQAVSLKCEEDALIFYQASLDSLTRLTPSIQANTPIKPQLNTKWLSMTHIKYLDEPLCLMLSEILDFPICEAQTIFACIILYNLALLQQKMKRFGCALQFLDLVDSLFIGDRFLSRVFHPSFSVGLGYQRSCILEKLGSLDESLSIIMSSMSWCSAPENECRSLLPCMMLQMGTYLLQKGFIEEGKSILDEANSLNGNKTSSTSSKGPAAAA